MKAVKPPKKKVAGSESLAKLLVRLSPAAMAQTFVARGLVEQALEQLTDLLYAVDRWPDERVGKDICLVLQRLERRDLVWTMFQRELTERGDNDLIDRPEVDAMSLVLGLTLDADEAKALMAIVDNEQTSLQARGRALELLVENPHLLPDLDDTNGTTSPWLWAALDRLREVNEDLWTALLTDVDDRRVVPTVQALVDSRTPLLKADDEDAVDADQRLYGLLMVLAELDAVRPADIEKIEAITAVFGAPGDDDDDDDDDEIDGDG